MLVTNDTPKLPPRLRIRLNSAEASLLRDGGRPTYDTALSGMNRNGIHITCDTRAKEMLQKPMSRSRLDAASIDQPTPSTAIRISHFGWISRPVIAPEIGISTNEAMPPIPKVSPEVVAS